MNDPLARFQKAQLLAHEISDKKDKEGKEAARDYHAFFLMDKTDKSTRLQIRRVAGVTHSPSYTALLDVRYDGFHGTAVILVYSFMQVKIKGKNLQSLISAIEKHECGYIQDYDERFFVLPQTNAALIASIEVVAKES